MMRTMLVALMGLLLVTFASASTIDLNQDEVVMQQPVYDALNEEPVVHAFIDGYDAVGVQIDDVRYVITVENDSIVDIDRDDVTQVDYQIETTVKELLYVHAHHKEMGVVDMFRFLFLDKDIPLKVIFRVVGVLMEGGING